MWYNDGKHHRKGNAMKILVTAFEPFGGSSRNSSLETLRSLPDTTPGVHRIVKAEIPVEYDRCGTVLREAAAYHTPDAVVCLGQAEGRSKVTPEYIAVNVKNSTSPDNGGRIYRFAPIEENAPDGIFTTLPAQEMTAKMQEAGIPAAVSFTAGTYVCNTLMYCALRIASPLSIPAGFIHLPLSSEIAAAEHKTSPVLPQDTLTQGILLCLDCLG